MRIATLLLPLLLVSCAAPGGRRTVNPPDRTDGRPFSHGVLAGNTYYVAGTLGLDPETNAPPAAVEDEVRAMLDAFLAKLELVDMTMDDLVSVQVFCPDLSLYGAFNEVYATYFTEGYPVRAFIGSGELLRGCRFEMNGIAVRR